MTPEDAERIETTATIASKQKSLEQLFDYTKFHIGVYLTLTSAYVTVASIKDAKDNTFILHLNYCLVWPAVIFFMIAGLAGGVIASSITQTEARSSGEFLEERIGPWDIKYLRLRARIWTWIEHTAFWAGLIFAVISILHR